MRVTRGVPFRLLRLVLVGRQLRLLNRVIVWLPATPPAEILPIEYTGESLGRLLRRLRGSREGGDTRQGTHADEDTSDLVHDKHLRAAGIVAQSSFQLPATRFQPDAAEARVALSKSEKLGAGSWKLEANFGAFMSRKYRVAVLGLGHWYSAYNLGRSLPEYPRAELVAAAWPDRVQLDAFAKAFSIHGYENYHDLLAREDIDIVHLAAPVSSLAELAIAAAKAGKHILHGKPMAMTLEEADRIVAAVEAAGVTCVPYSGLTRLRTADLKARVDAGEIGDVMVIHQTSRWSIAEDGPGSGRPGWFADRRHVPGGALIDEGIYWIELFEWMAG